ncbi:MAG: hypothetical protein JWL89_696 [Candidatus Saccharibacteria bacterium]|nr:hypothetical protein [Candidatus Saccharibacteria bacterium]
MRLFNRLPKENAATAELPPPLTIAQRIASLPLVQTSADKRQPSLIVEGLSDGQQPDEAVDPYAMRELVAEVYDELYGPNPNERTVQEHQATAQQSRAKLFGPDQSTWPV